MTILDFIYFFIILVFSFLSMINQIKISFLKTKTLNILFRVVNLFIFGYTIFMMFFFNVIYVI